MGADTMEQVVNQNSFVNKVTAERAVLKVINEITSNEKQLCGLSTVAIEAWVLANARSSCDPLATELRELSGLCQRLSDRSHETFDPLDETIAVAVTARVEGLSKKLETGVWN